MKYSDKTIKLIQSLTSSEKRYFILSVKKDEKKQYIKLYKVIEKKIKRTNFEIKPKDLKEIKNISFNKKYLYNTILKNLRNYKANSSVKLNLLNVLLDIKFLKTKGLTNEVILLINRGKKIARKHELHLLLLQLLNEERELVLRMEKTLAEKIKILKTNTAQTQKITQSFLRGNHIGNLYSRTVLANNFVYNRPEAKRELTSIIQDKELYVNNSELNTLSNIQTGEILSIYNFKVREDYARASLIYGESLTLQIKNIHLLLNNFLGIYPGIYNYCLLCIKAKKYDEVEKYIYAKPFKYLHFKNPSPFTQCCILILIKTLEIQLHIEKKEYGDLVVIEAEIKKLLKIYVLHNECKEVNELYFFMAIFCFKAGKLGKALIYSEKLLNSTHTEYKLLSLLFNLIIYYESGQQELLNKTYKLTSNYIDENDSKILAEYNLFIDLVAKKMTSNYPKKKIDEELEILKQKLIDTQQVDDFFIDWIGSKIKKTDFWEPFQN